MAPSVPIFHIKVATTAPVLKFNYGGDVRRGQENSTDWNADILYSKAKKYFSELKDLDFVLKYRKNEDHLCILTSATFSDFAILNQQSAILRLEIDI